MARALEAVKKPRRKLVVSMEDAVRGIVARSGTDGLVSLLFAPSSVKGFKEVRDIDEVFREAFDYPEMKRVKRRKTKDYDFIFWFDSVDDEMLFRLKYL